MPPEMTRSPAIGEADGVEQLVQRQRRSSPRPAVERRRTGGFARELAVERDLLRDDADEAAHLAIVGRHGLAEDSRRAAAGGQQPGRDAEERSSLLALLGPEHKALPGSICNVTPLPPGPP